MVTKPVKAGKLTLVPMTTSFNIDRFNADCRMFVTDTAFDRQRIVAVSIDKHFEHKGTFYHPVLKAVMKLSGETPSAFPFWLAAVDEVGFNAEIVHKTVKLGTTEVTMPILQSVADLAEGDVVKVRLHRAAASAGAAPAATGAEKGKKRKRE